LTEIDVRLISAAFANFTPFEPSLRTEDVDIIPIHFLVAADLPLGVACLRSIPHSVKEYYPQLTNISAAR
jgi:hypothetical protein